MPLQRPDSFELILNNLKNTKKEILIENNLKHKMTITDGPNLDDQHKKSFQCDWYAYFQTLKL